MMLTAKQTLFVAEYLKDLNATQAAIRAGYSEKTSYSIGQENLNKPEIADAIQSSFDKRLESVEIDATWLLNRLVKEAEADVADLYDDNEAIKPIKEWPLIWRQGLVAGMDVQNITSDEKSKISITKIKISDRIKRLELIGKHINVGAFMDRSETVHIVEDAVDDRELARKVAFILTNGVGETLQ